MELKPSSLDFNQCFICLEQLTEPKTLRCQHSFCLTCLEQYEEFGGADSCKLYCPVCSQSTPIPHGGLKRLPDDHKAKLLATKDRKPKASSDTPPVPCFYCGESSPAAVTCEECCEALCAQCVRQHSAVSGFSQHRLAAIRQAQPQRRPAARPRAVLCRDHRRELVSVCSSCNLALCHKCLTIAHSGHDSVPLQSDVTVIKQRLLEQVEQLRGATSAVSTSYTEEIARCGRRLDAAEAAVLELCRERYAAVQADQRRLVAELTEHRRRLAVLRRTEQGRTFQQHSATQLAELLTQLLTRDDAVEIKAMHTDIETRAHNIITQVTRDTVTSETAAEMLVPIVFVPQDYDMSIGKLELQSSETEAAHQQDNDLAVVQPQTETRDDGDDAGREA